MFRRYCNGSRKRRGGEEYIRRHPNFVRRMAFHVWGMARLVHPGLCSAHCCFCLRYWSMMPASISRKVLSQALTLFALAGCSSYLAAAKIPVNLSDNIVTCGATTRCSNKKMFGRTYKVIDTARFTVMVSISNEGRYTRADVSIANHAGYSQNISPEDFRVEVVSPKAKVLEYVPPAELQNMAVLEPAAAPARAVTESAGQSVDAQSL